MKRQLLLLWAPAGVLPDMNGGRGQLLAALFALRIVAIAFVWFAFAAPGHAAKNEAVGAALKLLFEQGKTDTGSTTTNQQLDQLKIFYAGRSFKPLWVRDNGPKGKAKALVAELRTSQAHGLSAEFYNLQRIEELFGSKDANDLARLELLLDGALVEFGQDLSNGRITSHVKGSMNAIRSETISADSYIAKAEATGNLRQYMSGLLQSDKRYVRLIAKLSEFLRMQYSRQWPTLATEGGAISNGAEDTRIEQIRKLLVLSGDMPISAMNVGNVHDETSIEAVKHFQKRHGLEINGALNDATLAQMAIPIEKRIHQIQVNLERRRWQVSNVSNDHAYVNLADGTLRLVKDGKTIGHHRVRNFQELASVPALLVKMVRKGASSDADFVINSNFLSAVSTRSGAKILQIDRFDEFNRSVKQNFSDVEGNVDLPIFVTYVTAWATRDGSIHFRNDKAGRDAKLAKLLGLSDN